MFNIKYIDVEYTHVKGDLFIMCIPDQPSFVCMYLTKIQEKLDVQKKKKQGYVLRVKKKPI